MLTQMEYGEKNARPQGMRQEQIDPLATLFAGVRPWIISPGPPRFIETLRADRPCYFAIVHAPTSAILFQGNLRSPNA